MTTRLNLKKRRETVGCFKKIEVGRQTDLGPNPS